jgi:hypothetical protein
MRLAYPDQRQTQLEFRGQGGQFVRIHYPWVIEAHDAFRVDQHDRGGGAGSLDPEIFFAQGHWEMRVELLAHLLDVLRFLGRWNIFRASDIPVMLRGGDHY